MIALSFALLFGAANIASAALVYAHSENNTNGFSGMPYTFMDSYDPNSMPWNPTMIYWTSWTFEAVHDDIIGGYAIYTFTDAYNNNYYMHFNSDQFGNIMNVGQYTYVFYDTPIQSEGDPFLAWMAAVYGW